MGETDKVGFVLCADDFGLSPAVSDGILEAVSAKRLSAVSCMATMEDLSSTGPRLQNFAADIDIGLHLTLTDLPPLGPMPRLAGNGTLPRFGHLARTSIGGGLPIDEIRTELRRQLDRFIDIFGRMPDFLDGHHHIQQLSGIRNVVLDMAADCPDEKPWLRTCDEKLSHIVQRGVSVSKALFVGWPGRAFQHQVLSRKLSCNNGFAGIYDFSGEMPYEALFDRFTDHLSAGALIMCHPGRVDDELRIRDGLTDQRETELDFLLSEKFKDMLSAKNLRLARLKECFDRR